MDNTLASGEATQATPAMRLLLVGEQGETLDWLARQVADALGPQWEISMLGFRFVEGPAPGALSAWRSEQDELCVLRQCQGIDGGFRQQALNRHLSEKLIGQSVDLVVVLDLHGCTVDLPRIAGLLHVPVALWVENAPSIPDDPVCHQWLADSLGHCRALGARQGDDLPEPLAASSWMDEVAFRQALSRLEIAPRRDQAFDYATYEFCMRDHPLLVRFQEGDVRHFKSCRRVLDLGCGAGIFLDLLRAEGIQAKGVERSAAIADYGRGMGLDIHAGDALEYLQALHGDFDGIYCSHFVEHLPFEAVQTLIRGLAKALDDNGVLVLVFPDPESIRSQLFGFWQDPEHVRFYHPDLITSVARTVGLVPEWSSYREQPHEVSAFPLRPLAVPPRASPPPPLKWDMNPATPWERLLSWMGIGSHRQFTRWQRQMNEWMDHVACGLESQRLREQALIDRTEMLWAINRTWAWNDNVTLRFRKPPPR